MIPPTLRLLIEAGCRILTRVLLISVADLQGVASARLDDARALVGAGRFDGAVYLCGYAVEIALKARICRTLHWSGFPSSRGEFQNLESFRTHDLEVLLRLSGFEAEIKQNHFGVWNPLAVWKVETRYNVIGTASPPEAAKMIAAADAFLALI